MTPYFHDAAVTLYHGDCLDILPQIETVDHVITDPPYSRDVYVRMAGHNTHTGSHTPARIVSRKGSAISQMMAKRVIERPNIGQARTSPRLHKLVAGEIGAIDELIEPVSHHLSRMTQRWVIVFSDAETTWRWRAELEGAGMRYVRTGAWVKPDAMPQMSGDRPAVGFEPCTICHATGPMRWNGGGHQAVWTYGTAKINRPDHPCPKPEPLMRELVAQFTDPGELILDPFAGSGTTGVAAKRLGRRCILIEREEKYCEIAVRRLAQGALNLFAEALCP